MFADRCAAGLTLVLLITAPVAAQGPLQSATIVEHVGAAIPRDLTFTDSSGRPVRFGSLLGDRPVILSLAYFTCPMLCHLGQDGAADAFRASGLTLGDDFRAVTVSIDPRDTPQLAREWRERAAAHAGVGAATMDWRFLVGRQAEIQRLADAVGFRYAYDADSNEFSHAAALFVITADGHISRYVYGITFEPAAIRTAVADAQANKSGGSIAKFILRCFHYIPSARRHGSFVVWLLRLGGLAVTASIAVTLGLLWRREKGRRT